MYSPVSQFFYCNALRAARMPCRGFLVLAIPLLIVSWPAEAVTPAPDGDYGLANTAEGFNALFSLTLGGYNNTAIGGEALHDNTTGKFNTAIGAAALRANTSGTQNTASGADALHQNKGDDNTATGYAALQANTTGFENTANGAFALLSNITGFANTGVGFAALKSNTNGNFNTAFGLAALEHNQTGDSNTAIGWAALSDNTGNNNTATGLGALNSNKGGGSNTAVGEVALQNNVSGSFNTATGVQSLNDNVTGFFNTACGYQSLFNMTGGVGNIALGSSAGVNLIAGNHNIYIGSPGEAGESNTIRIGTVPARGIVMTRTFIGGVSGIAVTGPAVHVNGSGQLGIVPSSARFKEAIRPMDKVSEAILSLQPVTFRYKQELDPNGIPQFGLVAEQVEKVNPDLIVRDEDGKVTTVRYEAVNAMLLNEFLKEHGQVQQLKATVAQQQKQIEALTATVQKVSERVELSAPAPQIAANED